LSEQDKRFRFEEIVMPHLAAAYNLARWLICNDQDAEDVVQEAYLRAFKFFSGYRGGESRAWLLTIVRNTCYTWLQQHRSDDLVDSLDEKLDQAGIDFADPETILLQRADAEMVRVALAELPVEFREIVIMREMEGLSYKEIAMIADVPMGTVMSRLARGRNRLQALLSSRMRQGGGP